MGKISATANAVKALIEADANFIDVDVVIDEQEDIEAKVAAAVEKAKGLLLSMLFLGTRKIRPGRYTATFVIEAWGRKVAPEREELVLVQDAVEYLIDAIDEENVAGGVPSGADTHNQTAIKVNGASLIPDENWLKYAVEFTIEMGL